ncbi:hypothetical protein KCU67_g15258, partial [Aureobasidium melanogenum]
YIKRVVSPYTSLGGDYVQASQNPVRGNLVTVTGGTSSSSSSTSSGGVVVSSSTTSTSLAPLVSSANYSCPANDQQRVVDVNGYVYTLGCGNDTTGGGTLYSGASDFNGCFSICDGVVGCTGFTWYGNCYIKQNVANMAFVSQSGRVGAIRAITATATAIYATTTTSSSSSSTLYPTASQASYSCPANNYQNVVDAYGAVYLLGCGNDTMGGGTLTGNPSSFNDCFGYCDGTVGCDGWTYNGACYLKINLASSSDWFCNDYNYFYVNFDFFVQFGLFLDFFVQLGFFFYFQFGELQSFPRFLHIIKHHVHLLFHPVQF